MTRMTSERRNDMSVHRGYPALAILATLLALPACDAVDRARSQLGTTDTVSGPRPAAA
jgi:hypothetical protein